LEVLERTKIIEQAKLAGKIFFLIYNAFIESK